MFPKNAVVRARKAFESLYDGTFTVVEHQKVKNPDHTTGFSDVEVLKDQPCRLSFASSPIAGGGDVSALTQTVKLFYSPEIRVKEGSKITVTQNGIETQYRQSGTPMVYATHAETELELFKGWA